MTTIESADTTAELTIGPTHVVSAPLWLERVCIAALAWLCCALLAGSVLAWFGSFRPGPIVIISLAGGYSLYALYAQDDRDSARITEPSAIVQGLVVLAVIAATGWAWLATGSPLADGTGSGHLQSGYLATVDQTLDHPLDVAADVSVEVSAPGLRIGEATWSAEGPRLFTVAVAMASWLGPDAGFKVNSILAALLLVVVFLLASRWVRSGIALAAAAALAVGPALLFAARGSAPEVLTAVLMVGGLWLLTEAYRFWSLPRAGVAGIVLGSAAVSSLSGLAPFVGVAAFLVAESLLARVSAGGGPGFLAKRRSRRFVLVFVAGAAVPVMVGAIDAVRNGWMEAAGATVAGPSTVLLATTALVLVGTKAGWTPTPRARGALIGVAILAAGSFLAYCATLRVDTTWEGEAPSAAVEEAQRFEGLDVFPSRTYAEQSVVWIRRYAGLPLLVLGFAGLGWLALAARNGGLRTIRPLLFVALFGITSTVWRPGAGAVQPAAVATLLPVVIPLLLVGAAWVVDRWYADAERYLLQTASLLAVVSLFVVPAVRIASVWDYEPQEGAFRSIRLLCGQIDNDDAVLVVDAPDDRSLGIPLAAAIRAYCAVPAAYLPTGATEASADRFASLARGEGRLLSLITSRPFPFDEDGPGIPRIGELKYETTPGTVERFPDAREIRRWMIGFGPYE